MKIKNDSGAASTLVVIVFTSLIFSSMLISYFLMAIYGVQVSGLDLPTGQQNFLSSQNFATNQINETIIDTTAYGIWDYQENIGRVLTNLGTTGWSYLLINNIQKDSTGLITNVYHINNSVKGDYTIVLRNTGGSDQNEFTITNDGIRVPNYLGNIVINSPLVISIPNMNQVEDAIITTIYNDKENKVDITFNGAHYLITGFGYDTNPLNLFSRHYGGVASKTLGFTLVSFTSQNAISYNPDTDILSQLAAFLVIAFKLVLYNVDSQFLPWEINIMLIKTQTIALLVGLINMRSGG